MEDLEIVIARISDSVLRAQRVWEKFIRRLKADAWDNQVCVVAMAKMFSASPAETSQDPLCVHSTQECIHCRRVPCKDSLRVLFLTEKHTPE